MPRSFFTLILMAGFLIMPAISFAQEPAKTPEERAASFTQWMKSKLALTAEQEPKVEMVNLRYAQKNEALKSSSAGKRQKLKTLKEDEAARDAELKGLLSAEQYKTYQDSKAELKQKMKEKRKE